MLTFEVEFLTGVSVAATASRRDRAEWPPHPDRLFQALVAAWGRNEETDEEEQAALQWLEALPTDGLVISAPPAFRRDVATAYVPPNDSRTTGRPGDRPPVDIKAGTYVVPEWRKNRQPRAFPAMVPAAESPVVHYIWPTAEGIDAYRQALSTLASEVTYLGHSHCLVRVTLLENRVTDFADQRWIGQTPKTLRLPHKNRLRHLQHQYARSLAEPRISWPKPSLVTKVFVPPAALSRASTIFDPENVTIFADDGGFVPALDAFPLVAKRMRDALLSVANREGLPIPMILSGHDADRRPTSEPHIAILPLADVGWKHSHGRLLGLALVWPRHAPEGQRKSALRIIANFVHSGAGYVPLIGNERERTGRLRFGRDGCWQIALEPESDRASLRFDRYVRPSQRWATVLPVSLDRHSKNKPGEDLIAIVARACINIGLPPGAIDGIDIEFHKHSAIAAAPSITQVKQAFPSDSRYREKPMCHLVLTFPQPIVGPLVLGAGRFRGLGLCLPLDDGTAQ